LFFASAVGRRFRVRVALAAAGAVNASSQLWSSGNTAAHSVGAVNYLLAAGGRCSASALICASRQRLGRRPRGQEGEESARQIGGLKTADFQAKNEIICRQRASILPQANLLLARASV
jgi:hypothetical protein